MTTNIPDVLPGHWTTPAGSIMAQEYAEKTRERLCGGQFTDMEVAARIALTTRGDLDHEARLQMAKDRIRWLSVQLAMAKDAMTLQQAEAAAGWASTISGKIHLIRNAPEHTDEFALGWERAIIAVTRTFAALATPAVLRLEAGKCYITADGQETTPLQIYCGDEFTANIIGGCKLTGDKQHSWGADGLQQGSGRGHCDLVRVKP